ncbi:MBL fold metallo-hydrolase [Arthrobacter sp. R1-13]
MNSTVTNDESLLGAYLLNEPLITVQLVDGPRLQESGFRQAEGITTTPRGWLIGTGTPKILPTRAGPSTYVDMGSEKILVDCGAGATERLVRLGVDPSDLTHILITHHHLDHNAELAWLVLAPWVDRTRRSCPLIVGPPGTAAFVNRLLAAYDYDIRTRRTFGIAPETLDPRVLEVDDGTMLTGEGWSAVSFRVEHDPVDQAFGYRFDWENGSAAISGDTAPSPNLIRYCEDVDVLVHEALYPGFGFPAYHTTVHQLGEVASAARAKHLVLTHLIPGHLPDEMWRTPIARTYKGPITVGSDLMRIF